MPRLPLRNRPPVRSCVAPSAPGSALIAIVIALVLALAGTPTRAGAQSPTDSSGYVSRVVIGVSPCPKCPPRICPEVPVRVLIGGALPSDCYRFAGAQVLATGGRFEVIAVDVVIDTCGRACTLAAVPFAQALTLSPQLPGPHPFVLIERTRVCPDTTAIASTTTRLIWYEVAARCDTPPTLDSLVRSFSHLRVLPEAPCVGDTLRLQIAENGCPPCVHITGLEASSIDAIDAIARLEWTPTCAELACISDTLTVRLGHYAAGSHTLSVRTEVLVRTGTGRDSVLAFMREVSFFVGQRCGPPPPDACLNPQLPPVLPFMPPVLECNARVAPGGRVDVVLPVSSAVSVAGAQGSLYLQPPFRVVGVRYAGTAQEVITQWQADGARTRFVLIGTAGEVISPGLSPLLRVSVALDSSAATGGKGQLYGTIEVASDAAGDAIPLCAVPLSQPPALVICADSSATPSCDVNHDGRSDVRDLVKMVQCLRLTQSDPRLPEGVCHDCNHDAQFNLDDIFCCARQVLHGSGLPHDSSHVQAGLSIAMEAGEGSDEFQQIRLHVRGVSGLSAALLRVRYPADRWCLLPPPGLADPSVPRGWLPIDDLNEVGMARMGVLRLEDSAVDELDYTLYLARVPGSAGGGSIVVEGADMILPDGGVVTPAAALPSVALGSPPIPTRIELSPARPNPFGSATSFVVSLPRAARAELSIHDLAGRRVATLAEGVLEAGTRTFRWDGAGARDGVYFARLTVEGRVYSSRVALLKNGR